MQKYNYDSIWLYEKAAFLAEWIQRNLLNQKTFIQLGLILAILIITHILSQRSGRWAEAKFKNRLNKSLIRIHVSYATLFFTILFPSFLWLVAFLIQALGLFFPWLNILASLVLAWAIIRLTSSTIESPFLSNVVAIVVWVLAALNILGWLSPTVALMDTTALTIGKMRISLLMIVKGLLTFVILFWIIGLLSKTLERIFFRAQGLNPSQRVLFSKFSNIMLYVAAGIIGLNIVGLDLTALTVFSGALGLGIGFGLQKLFSNLVSGIILLLDKSIKPGDVIAIGDTYGWVNSLGARYVSILTRDGKEHLIPNENLITNNVENWSYSDKNIRVHVPISVAYNSDLKLVKKILLQVAIEHPRVLKNPPPSCLITGFGDSSIDHQLRCWIADPQDGIASIISDIYYRVWDLFKENGITIPFPQRDVNLKLDLKDLKKLIEKS